MLKRFLEKAKKSRFFSSFVILCSGSLWAQGITFLCSLLLTRIYRPYDLGILTYILSFSTMFTCVICGRYEIRIVDAPKRDVVPLVHLSFFLSCVFSVIITAGIYVYLILANDNPDVLKYAWFCFLILFLYGIMNILNAYNNRTEEYKIMAIVYVLRSIFQNLTMIGLGLLHCGVLGLLSGQIAGYFAGLRTQSLSLRREKALFTRISVQRMRMLFRKNIGMILFSVPATFINALSYSLLSVLLGQIFGMIELGFYCVSLRILGLPLSIFSSNISRLHYRDSIREIEERKNYLRCTIKMLAFAALIILPITVFLIVAAPCLFGFMFGTNWKRSGEFVRILSVMFMLRFLMGAIGFSFIIAGKQALECVFQLLLLVACFISMWITKAFALSIEEFLWLIAITYSLVYIGEIATCIFLSKEERCAI